MRRRLLIAVAALLVTVAFGWLLAPRRTGETPEIRLLQAPHATEYYSPFVNAEPPVARLPAGVIGLSPALCTAQFEIRRPKDGILFLTNGPFGVEILDAKRDCVETGTCGVAGMTFVVGSVPGGNFGYYNTSRPWGTVVRAELPIPPTARIVRFSVGFRGPTLEERWRMVFVKWGFIRRMPGLANSITRRLPRTEHWLVHRAEVQLPPLPDDNEPHNQHMQPDPAITSLFDGERP